MTHEQQEIERLRFMLDYASQAPTLEAARSICRDALNGVGGAYNQKAVRGEIEKLRESLGWCRNVLLAWERWEANIIMDDKCWPGALPVIQQKHLDALTPLQQERNAVVKRATELLA